MINKCYDKYVLAFLRSVHYKLEEEFKKVKFNIVAKSFDILHVHAVYPFNKDQHIII